MQFPILRAALRAGAAIAVAASLLGPAAAQAPFVAAKAATVAETGQGQLLGARHDGIYSFLGVPYATAERFMPPAKVKPWTGVRPAVTYGQNCFIPPMAEVANDELFNPHRYLPMSEDCLFLNVWTPGLGSGGKRPVMVWLHGGGYTNGSGIEQVAYDGENLARKGDVVVVTLNHRLNVLGFLDLSAYGDQYRSSGNASVMDLVASLEWVRDNIAAFGGDPGNVTIFGQSGGGSKVRTLMGTPAAKGLFHKAIVMSGSRTSPVTPQAASRKVAELTLAELGIGADQVDKLKSVDYATLLGAATRALARAGKALTAAEAGPVGPRWAPVVDGAYLPKDPVGDAWADQAAGIPLLVGNVLNEFDTVIEKKPGDLWADNRAGWSPDKVQAGLARRFGDRAGAVAQAFQAAYPKKPLAEAVYLDTRFRPGSLRDADLKARQAGAPVYVYMFAWDSPVMDGIGGAWHCSEIPHVFANAALVPTATGGGRDAAAVAEQVSGAWIAFARTGNPGHPGLPAWPAYTGEDGATMVFDSESYVSRSERALLKAAGAI